MNTEHYILSVNLSHMQRSSPGCSKLVTRLHEPSVDSLFITTFAQDIAVSLQQLYKNPQPNAFLIWKVLQPRAEPSIH